MSWIMGALSMCVKINLSVKTCVWYIYISSTRSSSHTIWIHLVFFLQVVNYILLQLWLLMNEWMAGCVRAGAQFGCWDFCIKESGDTGYCIKFKALLELCCGGFWNWSHKFLFCEDRLWATNSGLAGLLSCCSKFFFHALGFSFFFPHHHHGTHIL